MISCILTTPDIRYYFGFFLDYPSIVKIVRTLQKAINPDYHEHIQNSIDLRSRTFITDQELMKMLDWFPSVEKALHALSHAYVEGRSQDLAILQSHQGLDFVTEEILATTLRQHQRPFYNTAALFSTPKLQRFIETKAALRSAFCTCKIEDATLLKKMLKQLTPSMQEAWTYIILLRLLEHPDIAARRYLIEELIPIMDEFLKSRVFDISLENTQFDTVQEIILDPRFREVRQLCLIKLASFLEETDNRPLFEFFLNQNPDSSTLESLLDRSIERGDFGYLEEVLVKKELDIFQKVELVVKAYLTAEALNDNTAKLWIHALLQKEIVCSNSFWVELDLHFHFNDYTLGFIRKLIQNPLPLERATVVAIVKCLFERSHSPEWERVSDLLLKSRYAQFIPFSLLVSFSYHSIIQNVEGRLILTLSQFTQHPDTIIHLPLKGCDLETIKTLVKRPFFLEKETVLALIDHLHTLSSSPEWWETWDLLLYSKYAPLVPITYLESLIEESIKQNITNTLALALRHPCFRHNEIRLIKNIIQNPIPLKEATVLTLIDRLHTLRASPGCLEGWEVLLNSKYVHFVPRRQWSFLFEESIKQNNLNILTLTLDHPTSFEHYRPLIWLKIIENICKENFEQARTVEKCFYRYYPRAYWALKVCLLIPTMILAKTVRLTSRFLIWLYERYTKRT